MEKYLTNRTQKIKHSNPQLQKKIENLEEKLKDTDISTIVTSETCTNGAKHNYILLDHNAKYAKTFYYGCITCEALKIVTSFRKISEK